MSELITLIVFHTFFTRMNTCTHAFTHKRTCTHTRTCTCTSTHTHEHANTLEHERTHSHTHTNRQTHAEIVGAMKASVDLHESKLANQEQEIQKRNAELRSAMGQLHLVDTLGRSVRSIRVETEKLEKDVNREKQKQESFRR